MQSEKMDATQYLDLAAATTAAIEIAKEKRVLVSFEFNGISLIVNSAMTHAQVQASYLQKESAREKKRAAEQG